MHQPIPEQGAGWRKSSEVTAAETRERLGHGCADRDMPNLVLALDQRADLVAYITSPKR